ncbi:AMP-binding protein [Streptomyces sp. H27-D2]|uniref:AMP-binding protein n=1 Tax=Streptomyces sp. H27-D2 TaxID=3046304 RepID=UPI002DBB6620|nr:AMP-binding protein [Streptomyces sp. H27-D2]MEC4015025.1 AMP-binding protein [Streptomyces sp. H27-D2]
MRDLTSWLIDPSTDAGINYYDGRRWQRHTYAEFAQQVLDAAGHLRQHGVGKGDRVALMVPSGPVFARYFFGAIAIGATPTPIAPNGYQGPVDYATFVADLLTTLRPDCVVSAGETLDILADLRPDGELGPLRVVDAGQPAPQGTDRSRAVLAKDDLALIQFTSGSSSAPRGVTLTNEAVLAQVALLEEKYRIAPGCSFGSWLPLHHDMGLIGLFVTPVVLGAEVWLMRPEHFIRRPLEWLTIFGRHGGTHSAIPNFALERVMRRIRPEDVADMDFSAWRALIVGSDRVSMPALDSLYELLAPSGFRRETLSPSYGMAEATLAVSAAGWGQEPSALLLGSTEFSPGAPVHVVGQRGLGRSEPGDAALHSVVSCGSELLGVDITVVGEDGHPLPDGHVGELLVRSPALSTGYFGDPPENERFSTGGYRTGDLGFRVEEQIYVLGRAGDSVKVNGRFVTAEDVELALVRALGLQPDKLAVVLHSAGGSPAVLATVQRAAGTVDTDRLGDVLGTFGLSIERSAVLHVGALAVPRTTSGKPQRTKLWRSFTAGELSGSVVHVGQDFPYRCETASATGRSRIAVTPAPVTGREGPAESRARLGGKGFHLTLMRQEGLPVPPFAVFDADELAAGPVGADRIRTVLAELADAAADTMGPRACAVGLAVRSSPPSSMPGMMDTLLGIGLSPADIGPLTQRLGDPAAAWEMLLTQARHLCRYVGGADAARLRGAEGGPAEEPRLRFDRLRALYGDLTGGVYPADPIDQVRNAVEAVRASWQSDRAREYRRANGIPEEPGPAVVVQAMAYGMAGSVSGSGVVFSHNPINGDAGLFGEYVAGSTGEDLVSGTRTPQAISALWAQDGAVHAELAERVAHLHRRLKAMVDVEFVVENGKLWLVQVRPAAAAPHVLNQVAQGAWRDGQLTAEQTLRRMDLDALFTPLPTSVAGDHPRLLAVGLPACAGVARGPVVTSTEEILSHPAGEAVLLRPTTEPSDFAAMVHAAAVVTLEGGGTSHAAVVARELNVPTVVGAHIVDADFAARVRARESADGGPLPEVTVCGTTGRVWVGEIPAADRSHPDRPEELLQAAKFTTVLCLPYEEGSAAEDVVLVDDATGTPLAIRPDSPGTVRDSAAQRALVCRTADELPTSPTDRLVATGDARTAEVWAGRGGRVAYLHPHPGSSLPSRADLPGCPLELVVLAVPGQREHARWTIAIAEAKRAR